MEFALSMPQVVACIVLAAAVSVLVAWFDRRVARRNPDKITVRLLGSAVAAEPGDAIMIGVNGTMSEEEYQHIREAFQPLIEKGFKVGLVENTTDIVVARSGGVTGE
ncbi:hypothetical protein HUN42_00042 [Streptomyces phage Dagobah]|nr:hypothetical protein HUN42_00042 [Streptomyces phage Dagobah]